MLFSAVLEILVNGNENDDRRGYEREHDVGRDLLAAWKEDIAKEAPKERDAYSLTVGYFSACHAYILCYEW